MSPRRGRWSGWDGDGGWAPAPPKLPPPADGIKLKKAATTWWGQRWIAALEAMSAGYSGRLERGRTYARAGRTHDLVVVPGRVTAAVTGSRPTPYQVTLELPALAAATWTRAIATMASRAEFAASLLAGEMPRAIDEAFLAADASLFPARTSKLETWCSCPDSANPCKHIAATHYVLGQALDADPFLLFELRGRDRPAVLTALRAARAVVTEPAKRAAAKKPRAAAKKPRAAATTESPTTNLAGITAETYDAWRAPPPALHLTLQPPASPGALLRQLGQPACWSSDASPADLLAPLIRAAADRARQLAGRDEPDD